MVNGHGRSPTPAVKACTPSCAAWAGLQALDQHDDAGDDDEGVTDYHERRRRAAGDRWQLTDQEAKNQEYGKAG